MSAAVENPAPALPDYVLDPNAVLKDTAEWRYGKAPDYNNTRSVFERTKITSHTAPSLPFLVQNLVKNWEIEASFKTSLSNWRTIDRPNYSFAINGGPPQSGEHMLAVGTYNAIIAQPNEFYSPRMSNFASSHKTFKRMMPTFAWEVLEVYSGPPTVAFRWRHWGDMKNDYVGFNDAGEKITATAHGNTIDIQGVTVATVNEKLQLQRIETWFDPLEMFRQIAPKGVVNKEVVDDSKGEVGNNAQHTAGACPFLADKRGDEGERGWGEASEKEKEMTSTRGAAIAAAEGSEETRMAHEDLGVIREVEKEGMNKE